jgi:hypothetical protein
MKTIILNEKQMEILKEGMDRHSFISHVKDYLKQLFKNPIYAKPDSFLIANGLDGETLKKHLEDKNIIVKHTSIKNDGGKDMFHVRYSLSANDGDRPLRRLYAELFESNIIENTVLNETDCGFALGDGGVDSNNGTYETTITKTPQRRKTIYITKEQYDMLREEAVMDTAIGDFGYDAPPFKKKKDPAYNHKNMMKKSFNNE